MAVTTSEPRMVWGLRLVDEGAGVAAAGVAMGGLVIEYGRCVGWMGD